MKKIGATKQKNESVRTEKRERKEEMEERIKITKRELKNHDKEQQQPSEGILTDEGEDDVSMSSTEKQANAEDIEKY